MYIDMHTIIYISVIYIVCISIYMYITNHIVCISIYTLSHLCKWFIHSVVQCGCTHCNTLQHTATHCNSLQFTATHCTTLHHTSKTKAPHPPFHTHCMIYIIIYIYINHLHKCDIHVYRYAQEVITPTNPPPTHCITYKHHLYVHTSFPCTYTWQTYMTLSTQIATPLKSSKSRNSHSSVQIQIEPKSRFEFVPRDTGEFGFLDLVDFGDVAFSVESVID